MISNNDRSGWFGASDTDKVIARNRNTKTWKSWWSVKLGEQEPDFQGSKYTEAGNKYEHHILREINDKMEFDRQICSVHRQAPSADGRHTQDHRKADGYKNNGMVERRKAMSRLTVRGATSQRDINRLFELSNDNQFGRNEAYYKLQHYEDLEEQLEKLYGGKMPLDEVVENLNRVIQNGEEKLDYARILTNAEAEKWDKWKDIEKQGRLIELPCLPDEEVWISNKRFGTHKTMYASRGAIVDTIEAGYAIGYTQEEAEAKLKEMGSMK